MKFSPIQAPVLAIGLALASCYPVDEPQRIQQGPAQTPPTNLTLEQTRLLEEQKKLAEADLIRQQHALDNPSLPTDRSPTGFNNTQSGPSDYPFASKIPGKEGFVFSPYNKKVVDVRGIPSGTLVADPLFPASEKKYFRVP